MKIETKPEDAVPHITQDLEAPAQQGGRKAVLLRIARVVVSLILIAAVLSQVSVSGALAAMADADLRYLALALMLNFIGAALTASRWRLLLAAQAVQTTVRYLVARWMEACFFNQFLPSTIGGDSKRIYDSWKIGASKAGAVAAVGVDRLLGLLALMSFGVAALFLSTAVFGERGNLAVFVVASTAILGLVAFVIFFPPRWLRTMLAALKECLPRVLLKLANKIETAFRAYHGKSWVLTIGLAVSALLQLNVIAFYYLVGLSLGMQLAFVDYMLVIPVANIVLLLPITINGIGLREGVFAVLLANFLIDGATSVAFAWLSFGLFTVFGLLGGLVYATQKQPKHSLN